MSPENQNDDSTPYQATGQTNDLAEELATGGVNNSWGKDKCCVLPTIADSPSQLYPEGDPVFTDYKPNTNSWARTPQVDLTDQYGCVIEVSGQWDLADDKVLVETSTTGFSNWKKVGVIYRANSGRL